MPDEPTNFTPEELARYSRQLLLPGVGLPGQAKLRDARVLLIGLGGLGSPAALYLAAAGVGLLGLAEPDRIETHNLHRQILYDTPSVEAPKIDVARRRLANLNPHTRLRTHPEGLTPANALALFADYDVIVDGADNFPTRYLANDAAVRARRPLVHGSIYQYEGQVAVFDPAHDGPCYRCLFPSMPAPGEVLNCAEAGVFGAVCGVIGSLMAMETLNLLLGTGEPLRGRLLVFDALASTPRVVQAKRDPNCPCCGPHPDEAIAALAPELYLWNCAEEALPEIAPTTHRSSDTNERFLRDLRALRGESMPGFSTSAKKKSTPPALAFDPAAPPLELDVHNARAWLGTAAPPLVLDVREAFEVALCRLSGSRTIPLGEITTRLDELPRDRPILVHCHHGARSLQAAKMLRAKGFAGAVSLRGGIHAWAEEIEPNLARY
jgi:sulfur-carrier protein adenylyltransferase/sulfurtransferase